MSFKKYNLDKSIINYLKSINIIKPSFCQDKVIPKMLKENNVICKSYAGSGKTFAYLLPILQNIITNQNKAIYLILFPTNDLVLQMQKLLLNINTFIDKDIDCLTITNRNNKLIFKNQNKIPDIIIGTPQMSKYFFEENNKLFKFIKYIVFDECDMVLDLNFDKSINYFLNNKLNINVGFFSATINENLENILYKRLPNCFKYVDKINNQNPFVKHYYQIYNKNNFKDKLISCLNQINPYLCIIFLNKVIDVKEISAFLTKNNFKHISIYGQLDNQSKKQLYRKIDNNEVQYIVATDIAARGIDFKNVSHVISVEIPLDPIYYIHRSGRTGRFKKGDSILFIENKYDNKLQILKKYNINFIEINKQINNKKRKNNVELKNNINKIKGKYKKVKPGYKKKMQIEIKKVKNQYFREKKQNNDKK